jgi:thiamine-monophosphate kinase
MTELEIIERLQRRVPVRKGELILGIGDDCAIYRPRGASEDLLFTTDLLIEGVHFRPGTRAEAIGYRALARGLSDIAAMGGDPRFCLVSLAMPGAWSRHLDAFYRGLLGLARRHRVLLAGGDLAHSRKLTVDIIVCGAVPRGRALRRDGAKPGNTIYVSGPLGRAAAGGYRAKPVPRLTEGRKLRECATACMDLSDGLSIDLLRLCEASGLSADLREVPVAAGATPEQALHGGEDYELLYTGPEGLPGIPIGTMRGGVPGMVTLGGELLQPRGYDHFAYNSRR